MIFKIGGKNYEINDDVPYLAVRKIIDAAKRVNGQTIDMGAVHDDTYHGILMMLPSGSFQNIDELKKRISWREYMTIDEQLLALIVGDKKKA